jgi:hypothetical protein
MLIRAVNILRSYIALPWFSDTTLGQEELVRVVKNTTVPLETARFTSQYVKRIKRFCV